MDRGLSKPLWKLLNPNAKQFSLFSPNLVRSYFFDDFIDSEEDFTKGIQLDGGWNSFRELELSSDLNITESTRIAVEGRFRPIDSEATLLLGLVGSRSFFMEHRITETVKLGLAMDGQLQVGFSSVNGIITSDASYYIGPAYDLKVRCSVIHGAADCDWIACAEDQV